MQFDCAGSDKRGVVETSLPKTSFFLTVRALLLSLAGMALSGYFGYATLFCVRGAGHGGLFDVRGRQGGLFEMHGRLGEYVKWFGGRCHVW